MCFMLLTGSYGSMTVCKIPKKFCAKRFQPATFDHQESRLDVIDPLFLHLLPPPWIHLKFPHRCSLVTGCKPKITTIASGNHRWLPLFFPIYIRLHPDGISQLLMGIPQRQPKCGGMWRGQCGVVG